MIGSSEILIILVLALFLFGPKKLPELMRSLGRAVGEYQKAVRDFERETQMAALGQQLPLKPLVKEKEGAVELKEIAKNLGLDAEGKSDEQLLKEISEKTKKKDEGGKGKPAKPPGA